METELLGSAPAVFFAAWDIPAAGGLAAAGRPSSFRAAMGAAAVLLLLKSGIEVTRPPPRLEVTELLKEAGQPSAPGAHSRPPPPPPPPRVLSTCHHTSGTGPPS